MRSIMKWLLVTGGIAAAAAVPGPRGAEIWSTGGVDPAEDVEHLKNTISSLSRRTAPAESPVQSSRDEVADALAALVQADDEDVFSDGGESAATSVTGAVAEVPEAAAFAVETDHVGLLRNTDLTQPEDLRSWDEDEEVALSTAHGPRVRAAPAASPFDEPEAGGAPAGFTNELQGAAADELQGAAAGDVSRSEEITKTSRGGVVAGARAVGARAGGARAPYVAAAPLTAELVARQSKLKVYGVQQEGCEQPFSQSCRANLGLGLDDATDAGSNFAQMFDNYVTCMKLGNEGGECKTTLSGSVRYSTKPCGNILSLQIFEGSLPTGAQVGMVTTTVPQYCFYSAITAAEETGQPAVIEAFYDESDGNGATPTDQTAECVQAFSDPDGTPNDWKRLPFYVINNNEVIFKRSVESGTNMPLSGRFYFPTCATEPLDETFRATVWFDLQVTH